MSSPTARSSSRWASTRTARARSRRCRLIAAEELGVGVGRIRYRRASTSTVPDSGTTVASRGTIMGGGAVTLAARELKRRMAEAVCGRLQCLAGAVRFEDGELLDPAGHRRVSFDEAIRLMFATQHFPHVVGRLPGAEASPGTSTPATATPTSRGSTGARRSSSRSTRRPGKVRLLGAVAAHDVGRAVNREMVRGPVLRRHGDGDRLRPPRGGPLQGRPDHQPEPQHLPHPARHGPAGDEGDHHREPRPALARAGPRRSASRPTRSSPRRSPTPSSTRREGGSSRCRSGCPRSRTSLPRRTAAYEAQRQRARPRGGRRRSANGGSSPSCARTST